MELIPEGQLTRSNTLHETVIQAPLDSEHRPPTDFFYSYIQQSLKKKSMMD